MGQFLHDSKARDVLVLDVASTCSWASTFVIATYNSQGHLKGLVQELDDWSAENLPDAPHRPKKNQVNDWMLIDWDDIVIHLFSESARSYYELEKLWFNAPVLYRSTQ
ncbi:MAG: ribosome silencing factor [Spirochaetales bacterium]